MVNAPDSKPRSSSRAPIVFAVVLTLLGGGMAVASTPPVQVLVQPCTTDAECDDGQFCNGWETCDSNGQCAAGTPATCCSDPLGPTLCAEAFPRCGSGEGAGCQSYTDCNYDRCERCQPSCDVNADCADGQQCNGVETCRRTCLGGPNDGNSCIGNSTCTPGICFGRCQPGISPCAAGTHCSDKRCGTMPVFEDCLFDSDCPAGELCNERPAPGYVCLPMACGDGTIGGAEECDPNANLPNPMPGQQPNGCFTGSTCLPDTDPLKCTCTAFCGNGHIETGEKCDGSGWGLCPGACAADCTCAPHAPSSCGDGIFDWKVEECEDDCDCFGIHCRLPGDPMGECTCTCAVTPGPLIDWDSSPTSADRTTRSLRFRIPLTAACETHVWAIKITMVDLQNPVPPNLPANPPPDFSGYESATCAAEGETNECARWVGKPGTFLEAQDIPLGATYRAARLQCTPFYYAWSTEDLITVVGSEIVPSSVYDGQVYGSSCKGNEDSCFEVFFPERMYTRRSGDAEQPFNPPATSDQPDVTDVAQLVNKFKNLPGALVKAVSQLQPNLPELHADINALDIVAVVDAVKQRAYAFSGPCPCPSVVPCGVTACSSVTPCVTAYGAGATCVKTCSGGDNVGDPCINNSHCPGSPPGTCGNGFCRDRCGRCTP